jgi:hypothetical protein
MQPLISHGKIENNPHLFVRKNNYTILRPKQNKKHVFC